MSRKSETPEGVLAKTNEDLVCAFGEQTGLSWIFNEEGRERDLLPIRMVAPSRPGPYPEAFYRAQKWLRRNRRELQRYIIEELDFGAKRDRYGRGREAQLVADLATIVSPICQKPYPVDPLLAAALLVRIGLDKFCEGYDETQTATEELWSLEKAMGLDPDRANDLAREGNQLLNAGRWKDAVPLLEQALVLCPLHVNALNDLTYIYGAYYPKCEQGLKYARQLLQRTIDDEPAILDTIGWAGFRHGGNIDTVEACLRAALKWIRPGESGYITVSYHLMAVLFARNKTAEAVSTYKQFAEFPPTNVIDTESLASARQLIEST